MAASAGLKKKIGPLPAWAWGVLVLAVVGWFFLRSRSAQARAVDQTPSTADQPRQATGAARSSTDQGAAGGGLDPGILSQLLQATYHPSGGGVTIPGQTQEAASTSGASVAPDAAAGASPATVSAVTSTAAVMPANPSDPSSPYYTAPLQLPPGTFLLDPPSGTYAPAATGTENPSAALAGASVSGIDQYGVVGTSGTVGDFAGYATSTRGLAAVQPAGAVVQVDPSGHVVNQKGARVGGVTADS